MKSQSTLWIAIPLILFPACGGQSAGSAGTAPSALQYSEPFSVFMVDAPHTTLTPSVTGNVTSWSITPTLPSGLALDPLTGAIAGTAQVPAPRQTYTVLASNQSGSTQATIEFAVEKPERYAYVTSSDDRTISILGLEGASGEVSRRGFVVGQASEGHPEDFVPNPETAFGYSTTTEGTLSTWAIDEASGWLTQIDTQVLGSGGHALSVSPDGRHVFVSRMEFNDVWVYEASAATGLLSGPVFVLGVGPQPTALALDPSGRRIAVACAGDPVTGVGSILNLHSFDPSSATLSPLGNIRLNGAKPASCAFSVNRSVIYLGFPQLARVVAIAFDPATGAMTSLGNGFSGAGCGALALDPLGSHLWAVNSAAGTLADFVIRPDGGLTALGAIQMGSAPVALAIDPLGRFFFALDSATQELGLYDLDVQSRAATYRKGWLTRNHPVHVSLGRGAHALRSSTFELLTTAAGSSELLAHPVDSASGAPGAGVPVATGNGPASVTVDAQQRFAFTGNTQDHTIGRYRIDRATGALSELQPALQVNGVPIHVAADASGRFLYVALRGVAIPTDGYVSTFAVDGASGELTLLDSLASGSEPNWLGLDPTSELLYVANDGDGTPDSATIAVYSLDADNGLPKSLSVSPQASGVWSIGFHPSGRYLYAALRTTNRALPFKIDRSTGSLSASDSGLQAQPEPVSVAVTPDGHWAYVAYRNSGGAGSIGLCEIDEVTGGFLPPASPFFDGIAPADLRIDPSGRFLYSANSGTDTISAFTIEASDGFLQPLTPVATGLAPSALALLQRWQ